MYVASIGGHLGWDAITNHRSGGSVSSAHLDTAESIILSRAHARSSTKVNSTLKKPIFCLDNGVNLTTSNNSLGGINHGNTV